MCGQVVCEHKLCVTGGGDDGRMRRRRQTGCRTKNKNPTQRCGEKRGVSWPGPISFFSLAEAKKTWFLRGFGFHGRVRDGKIGVLEVLQPGCPRISPTEAT